MPEYGFDVRFSRPTPGLHVIGTYNPIETRPEYGTPTIPRATYQCPNCGLWTAFMDTDPEWFECVMCKRSVVPHGDG